MDVSNNSLDRTWAALYIWNIKYFKVGYFRILGHYFSQYWCYYYFQWGQDRADWFQAAVNRVNHWGILYKLCSVAAESSVLSVLTESLSNRSQHVLVDGCRSKLSNVVSGVPPGSVLRLCYYLHTFSFRSCFPFPFCRIYWSDMPTIPLSLMLIIDVSPTDVRVSEYILVSIC